MSHASFYGVVVLAVIYCPKWNLSPYSSISSGVFVYGTVATVSCDDGFVFPDGNVVETIECVEVDVDSPEAAWNVTSLTCQREYLRASS